MNLVTLSEESALIPLLAHARTIAHRYFVAQQDSPDSPTIPVRSAPLPSDPVAFLMWADMGANQYNAMEHFGDVDRALDLIVQV